MIKLNIGSDDEFNEIQIALERSLQRELEFLDEAEDPGVRLIAAEHISSIKIIKFLLGRLSDLESRKSFKKKKLLSCVEDERDS